MIVNAEHRAWIGSTLIALVVATFVYASYARSAPAGPRGGSPVGLGFGALALAFMLFAGLLGARRKVRTWRLGRARTWLLAHAYLALLAVPLVLFHAGFRLGGPMTTWLMALTAVVTASGVCGVLLQNVLPRLLLEQVTLETVYEQIREVTDQLRDEADGRVEAACGPLGIETGPALPRRGNPEPARARRPLPDVPPPAAEPAEGSGPLCEAYLRDVRPFLARRLDPGARLAKRPAADLYFAQLRRILPPPLHETVDDLASICEERRQLAHQQRLHRWLHGWLLVHVPLSYALLVLAAAHAVVTLRY